MARFRTYLNDTNNSELLLSTACADCQTEFAQYKLAANYFLDMIFINFVIMIDWKLCRLYCHTFWHWKNRALLELLVVQLISSAVEFGRFSLISLVCVHSVTCLDEFWPFLEGLFVILVLGSKTMENFEKTAINGVIKSGEDQRNLFNPMIDGVRWSEKHGDKIEKLWQYLPNWMSKTLVTVAVFLVASSIRGKYN